MQGNSAPRRLADPAAPGRQAPPARRRGPAGAAQPRSQLHAGRLGVPGRRGRAREAALEAEADAGRRLARTAPARCGSFARRPESSCPLRPSFVPGRGGSPRSSCRSASTPASTSPLRRPIRRRARRGGDHRGRLDRASRGSRAPRGRASSSSSSRRSSIWSRSCRTRAPTRCSRRLATDRSSRSSRAWSARARRSGCSCPASRGTDVCSGVPGERARLSFARDRHPAAGGPRRLRALHHLRVHDRRCPPAADRVAGDALLFVRGADARHHDRVGYPKKANDARRNPTWRVLFSDPTGSGIQSGIQVLVQGMAEVDDRDLEANRERYERESVVKLPRGRPCCCRASCAACRVVRNAHLHQGAPGAGLRVARRRHPSRPNATEPISKRFARARVRSRSSRTSHPRAATWPGMGGSRSSTAATRRPCSLGRHQTASRWPCACRSASTLARG